MLKNTRINQFIIILLFLSGFHFCNAQNTNLKYHSKYDSCKSQAIIPIVKSNNEVFTKGAISFESFNNLNKVALLSVCLRQEFEVKGFRMVGVAKDKDPIIVNVKGDRIAKSDFLKLKSLGNEFEVFIEDIKARDDQGSSLTSIRLRVK